MPVSPKLKCKYSQYFAQILRALQIDLLTQLAIIKLVIELISQLPQGFIIVGSWIQSRGINLGPTRRRRGHGCGRGREAEVAGDVWLQLVARPASPPLFGKI